MYIRRCFIFFIFFVVQGVSFSQTLKILEWNIFMIPPIIFKSCQAERTELIAEYILQLAPDILVLEEAFLKSSRKVLMDKVNKNYPYSTKITPRGFFKTNSGLWVLSKYPIKNQHFMTYKKKKGTDRFARKGALYVEVEIGNKPFQLIATHAQSFTKFAATREKQFKQLKNKLADIYFQDSIPQIILGDLNVNFFDSTEYQKMIDVLDVLPISLSGEKYSWDGSKNELAYQFFTHDTETLDYILLRKQHASSVSVISTEILNSKQPTSYCTKGFIHLSDHHPLMSIIKLK